MTDQDAFERRAASAGVALRAAFLVDQPISTSPAPTTSPATAVSRVQPSAPRRAGRRVPVAVALAAAAAVVAAFVVMPQRTEPVDVLGSSGGRERAVLVPPYLIGAGSVRGSDEHSVERFPVPFTFQVPPVEPGDERWWYRTGRDFQIGLQDNGVVLLAPAGTYAPDRTWRGQDQLVPAPVDAAGWAEWLQATGYVDIIEREQLLIGGASATRFTLALAALPDAYDGCGGGRRCLAIEPFDDPQVGAGQIGTGPQSGIDGTPAELTVIELEDRAVLVLATGVSASDRAWLAQVRRFVESLRFA